MRRQESNGLKQKRAASKPTDIAVVEESIRPYAIAEKLRTLRLRRSMGLAQLAEHTGFSSAMLSRLEMVGWYPHCRRSSGYGWSSTLGSITSLPIHESAMSSPSRGAMSARSYPPIRNQRRFPGISRRWTPARMQGSSIVSCRTFIRCLRKKSRPISIPESSCFISLRENWK
jgi:hypothetical protein